MNSIKIDNCVLCHNSRINNKGKDHEGKHFFIECDLNVWEGQRSVRISEKFANIPNDCPLIKEEQ